MITIPDHLIDNAAQALAGSRYPGDPWDTYGRSAKAIWRELARAALAAVADDLRAEGALTIRDALLSSLDIPTGPVQTGAMNATAGWASWITDRFNLPTPEETDR